MSHVATLASPSASGPDDPERRVWLLASGAAGAAAVAATAVPLVSSFAPSDRARAAGAAVEVDVSDIPPGGMKTVEWRGKPVWILRRTPEQLAALTGHEADLADPQSVVDQQPEYARNPARAIRPEVFVAIGICTHLGCSPNAVAAASGHPSVPTDWPGGFFCPCHGSTFDLAGRVFKNKPAPTNLEIPPHGWVGAGKLLIGEDPA
jgi:ubiquinol-cytochrome c reductase iron-sulfur subunit